MREYVCVCVRVCFCLPVSVCVCVCQCVCVSASILTFTTLTPIELNSQCNTPPTPALLRHHLPHFSVANVTVELGRPSSASNSLTFQRPLSLPLPPDMGLGKSEKGGKWCGGLGAAVGPQWGPGAKPLVGVWGQRPQKLKVFSVCHHKKQHSGAWKSDIC